MHRQVPFAIATLACALAACAPATDAGAAGAEPATAAAAAPPAQDAPVAAPAAGVLLDFRDPALTRQELPEEEQRVLAKLVDPGSGPEAAATSRMDGAFTAAGRQQQAVIVVPGGASTIDPSPEPATIAILEQGKVVARHTFTGDDSHWQWLLEAADVDGDGVDEMFLGSGWMQMGESGKNLLVASLDGGRFRQLEIIRDVARDDCQARRDAGGGTAQAAVISASAGELEQARYQAPCPAAEGEEGWAEGPAPQDYMPVKG